MPPAAAASARSRSQRSHPRSVQTAWQRASEATRVTRIRSSAAGSPAVRPPRRWPGGGGTATCSSAASAAPPKLRAILPVRSPASSTATTACTRRSTAPRPTAHEPSTKRSARRRGRQRTPGCCAWSREHQARCLPRSPRSACRPTTYKRWTRRPPRRSPASPSPRRPGTSVPARVGRARRAGPWAHRTCRERHRPAERGGTSHPAHRRALGDTRRRRPGDRRARVVVLANAAAVLDLLRRGTCRWPPCAASHWMAASAATAATTRLPLAGSGYLLPSLEGPSGFGATSAANDADPRVRDRTIGSTLRNSSA